MKMKSGKGGRLIWPVIFYEKDKEGAEKDRKGRLKESKRKAGGLATLRRKKLS